MPPKPKSEQDDIAEDFPYLQELMQAIAAVRHAIDAGKDGKDAAENLLAEIPDGWLIDEFTSLIEKERRDYNVVLGRGFTPTQRYFAGKNYSRRIVKIVINIIHKYVGLFKTRKKVEQGGLSIWKLGEGLSDDE